MSQGVVPFLTKLGLPADHGHALASVTELHRAGVTILAGSDANDDHGAPAHPEHGQALLTELELLVRAGLAPLEALRAATSLAARHFGLADRGVVAPGRRADLILVEGDPTTDISAIRRIRGVWCAGLDAPGVDGLTDLPHLS